MKKTNKKYILEIVNSICGITGVTVFSLLVKLKKYPTIYDAISKNIYLITIVLIALFLFYKVYVIPTHKIYRHDVPPEEAKADKSTILLCLLLIVIFSSLKIYDDVNANANNKIELAPLINLSDSVFSDEREPDNNYKTDIEKYDRYIHRCNNEIIPMRELSLLSDDDFYYIRNGILAYEGMDFSSDFYEQFDWYNGTIPQEDFDWNTLNHFQKENIENIKRIESNRSNK